MHCEKEIAGIAKPKRNYLDVKITYACNFKCEYCYQFDEFGRRPVGVLSKKHAEALLKFLDRLGEPYSVTLAGGEPFVYPHLDFLAENLARRGHEINIITNFSAPIDRIKRFISLAGNSLSSFSTSVHLSQWDDIGKYHEKLGQLVEFRRESGLKFSILPTCVLTEENAERVKELYYAIGKTELSLEVQRVYYGGQYATYPKHIDEFFADKGLDVPDDVANKVNFFGNKCWCGSKFFYIESDGQIRRCYTHQSNSKTYELGSLDDVDGITVFPGPIPCLSDDKISPCVCFKHFQRQAFLSDIKAEDAEIEFWNKYMRENPEPEGENTPHAEEKAPEQAKRGIIPSLWGKIFKSKRK